MPYQVTFDQNSVILRVKILDSAVTTGAGKTGLTSATSGLIISTIADVEATPTTYTVAGSTIETVTTLGTYAAPTATKCRFKLVDDTNHPGIYEIQLADARFSVTGAKSLLISILGASGAAQMDLVLALPTVDLFTAITYPANFATLSIDGSGRVDVIKVAGTTQTARDLGAQLDAAISTRATPTNITAGVITTVTNLTNAPTAGDLTATMKASVNAEAVDALNVDTYAEPGQEAPPATTTLQKKISYVFKMLRNKKTQTATTRSLFADDGTTVDQKATDSDDGTTYTKGELGTGP